MLLAVRRGMSNVAHRYQSAVLTALAASLTLACGAAPESTEPEPAAGDELTNSPQTTDGPSVVRIETSEGSCTASFLSPRWLITAAHCVDGNANGTLIRVRTAPNIPAHYDGLANYYKHPDYGGLSWWGTSDTDDDVALIELIDPSVLPPPGTASLYEDALYTGYTVKLIAFGVGSDPGQSSDCEEDGPDGIRRTNSYQLTTVELEKLELDYGDSEVCFGDSGGPWLYQWGGKDMITSVSANRRPYHDADSARLHPKLDWIETQTKNAGRPLSCPAYTLNGKKFRECFEADLRVHSLSSGSQHACASLSNGRVRCWGRGYEGQAGPASAGINPFPVEVALTPGEKAGSVAVGANHSCAIMYDQTVRCWGSNAYGQLGNAVVGGTYFTPQVVRTANAPLTGVTSLSAGAYHTCASRFDLTAFCWGDNSWGELGNSSTTSSAVARQVGRYQKPILDPGGFSKQASPIIILQQWVPEQNVVKVTAGRSHTCAKYWDGTAKCWGDNSYGKLGDGTQTGRTVPTAVYGLTNVQDISSGAYHTCAVRSVEPRVACWGYNGFGELANGSTSNSNYPWHTNLNMTGDASVAVGAFHSCFSSDLSGRQRCAGYNGLGALGITGSSTVLVDTPLPTEVTRVTAGDYFTCTLMDGGEVACTGANDYGQMGIGNTQHQFAPQVVRDLNTLL
jgi:alpha-tubulin suppressor-like RCC1 family protein